MNIKTNKQDTFYKMLTYAGISSIQARYTASKLETKLTSIDSIVKKGNSFIVNNQYKITPLAVDCPATIIELIH